MMLLPETNSRPGARAADRPPPFDEFLEIGRSRSLSWTAVRMRVLELLWTTRSPWGPYNIAQHLSRDGSKMYPNSVYRALRDLDAACLIVPIVTWNRYVISPDPGIRSWAVLLCSGCGIYATVAMPDGAQELWAIARKRGFRPTRAAIECVAACAACASTPRSDRAEPQRHPAARGSASQKSVVRYADTTRPAMKS